MNRRELGQVARVNRPDGPWWPTGPDGNLHRSTMHAQLASSPATRLVAALAALAFIGFSASGARVALPGLREASRGVAPMRTTRTPRNRLSRAKAFGSRPTGDAVIVIVSRAVAWTHRFAHLASVAALRGRTHAGTPRLWGRRGGNGRLGPGADL